MDHSRYDVVVVGGGIIGLATARQLLIDSPNTKIAVVEKESKVAIHQTGHNSGVIHAGIYYAPGSQKANFCSTGGILLREYCDDHAIPYEMCGKTIVATDETEIPRLEDLYERGTANGALGLEMIEKERLAELEPHAHGIKAIFSPNTGIIDFSAVSESYAADLKNSGGDLLLNTRVVSISRHPDGLTLETTTGTVFAHKLINCAGLYADRIAAMMDVNMGVRIVPFRGEYFSLTPESAHLVNGLIYPVPDPNLPFLGVHFTKRISGSVEAGPNAVLAFAQEGYTKFKINVKEMLGTIGFTGFWIMAAKHWKTAYQEYYRSFSKGSFTRSLQRLVPEIEKRHLIGGGAGVRAQAVERNGFLVDDFRISRTENAIHVRNAPSPGATASLAISRGIVDMAEETFGIQA